MLITGVNGLSVLYDRTSQVIFTSVVKHVSNAPEWQEFDDFTLKSFLITVVAIIPFMAFWLHLFPKKTWSRLCI